MRSAAQEALERLREGNRRFVAADRGLSADTGEMRRSELLAGQEPFAVILGCSDSRVPAEMVFDQGLGDLFVIRVAGNIVAPSQIGSVEFAADRFHTRLVIVLGHTQCGAVQATLDELQQPSEHHSRNLASIVERIRPAVEDLVPRHHSDPALLMHEAIRANVRQSVRQVEQGSPILQELITSDGLLIVGAEYSLETGRVDFFENLPA